MDKGKLPYLVPSIFFQGRFKPRDEIRNLRHNCHKIDRMLAVPDAAFMEELTAHVNMLIKDNRSIYAIRMVHDQLGWNLIDAKIFVDKRREELAKAGEI